MEDFMPWGKDLHDQKRILPWQYYTFFTQNWKAFKEIYFKIHFLLCFTKREWETNDDTKCLRKSVRGTHSPGGQLELGACNVEITKNDHNKG